MVVHLGKCWGLCFQSVGASQSDSKSTVEVCVFRVLEPLRVTESLLLRFVFSECWSLSKWLKVYCWGLCFQSVGASKSLLLRFVFSECWSLSEWLKVYCWGLCFQSVGASQSDSKSTGEVCVFRVLEPLRVTESLLLRFVFSECWSLSEWLKVYCWGLCFQSVGASKSLLLRFVFSECWSLSKWLKVYCWGLCFQSVWASQSDWKSTVEVSVFRVLEPLKVTESLLLRFVFSECWSLTKWLKVYCWRLFSECWSLTKWLKVYCWHLFSECWSLTKWLKVYSWCLCFQGHGSVGASQSGDSQFPLQPPRGCHCAQLPCWWVQRDSQNSHCQHCLHRESWF